MASRGAKVRVAFPATSPLQRPSRANHLGALGRGVVRPAKHRTLKPGHAARRRCPPPPSTHPGMLMVQEGPGITRRSRAGRRHPARICRTGVRWVIKAVGPNSKRGKESDRACESDAGNARRPCLAGDLRPPVFLRAEQTAVGRLLLPVKRFPQPPAKLAPAGQ